MESSLGPPVQAKSEKRMECGDESVNTVQGTVTVGEESTGSGLGAGNVLCRTALKLDLHLSFSCLHQDPLFTVKESFSLLFAPHSLQNKRSSAKATAGAMSPFDLQDLAICIWLLGSFASGC